MTYGTEHDEQQFDDGLLRHMPYKVTITKRKVSFQRTFVCRHACVTNGLSGLLIMYAEKKLSNIVMMLISKKRCIHKHQVRKPASVNQSAYSRSRIHAYALCTSLALHAPTADGWCGDSAVKYAWPYSPRCILNGANSSARHTRTCVHVCECICTHQSRHTYTGLDVYSQTKSTKVGEKKAPYRNERKHRDSPTAFCG